MNSRMPECAIACSLIRHSPRAVSDNQPYTSGTSGHLNMAAITVASIDLNDGKNESRAISTLSARRSQRTLVIAFLHAALRSSACTGGACGRTASAAESGGSHRMHCHFRTTVSGVPCDRETQVVEAVIHLAPPTVHDAIHDEALIVGRQGLVFEQGLASSANGSGRATRNTAARVTLRRQKMKAGAPAGTSRRAEPRCGQSRHVHRARAVPAARQARPRARWAGWHAARTDHSVH